MINDSFFSKKTKNHQQQTSINACNSSFNLCGHNSLSRGPAFVLSNGICPNDLRVAASTMIQNIFYR